MKKVMFELKKFKLSKTGGAQIDYIADDRDNTKEQISRTTSDVVHADLIAALQKLKPAIIKSHKLDWPTSIITHNLLITDKEKSAIDGMRHLIDQAQIAVNESVIVTGLALSGEGVNAGVVITGTLETKGRKAGIVSQRINFQQTDNFGIEEVLERDVFVVVKEIEEYLFNNKVGAKQGDLFDTEELAATETENEELPEAEENVIPIGKKKSTSAPKKKAGKAKHG